MKNSKRMLALLMALFCVMVFLPPSVVSAEEEWFMLGDVDGDGQVWFEDWRLVKQFVVGDIGSMPYSDEAADVNGDGKITVHDASQILQYCIGKIADFSPTIDGGKIPQDMLSLTVGSATDGSPRAVIHYEFAAPVHCGQFEITFPTDVVTLDEQEEISSPLPQVTVGTKKAAEGKLRVAFHGEDYWSPIPQSGVLLSIPFRFADNVQSAESDLALGVQIEELVTVEDEVITAYTDAAHTLVLPNFVTGSFSQGYFYRVNSDNASVTVTKTAMTDAVLRIPSSIDGKAVTAIGAGAFAGRTALKEVVVPNTVTAIGDRAFADCTALEVVTLAEGLCTVGASAFENDRALVTVKLPTTVTRLGNRTFAGCVRLAQLVIPKVNELGNGVIADSGVSLVVFNGSREQWDALVQNGDDYRTVAVLFTVLSKNGVSVGYTNGATFNVNVSLSVDTVKNEEILKHLAQFLKASALDISLMENGAVVQPDSTVNVELPIPEDMRDEDCYVVHVDAEGNVEVMRAERNGNSMNFKTNHFSVYAVVTGGETLGDVDGNHFVDSTDARLVLQHAVGKIALSDLTNADVDKNNKVDSTDARLILQYAVGKIKSF